MMGMKKRSLLTSSGAWLLTAVIFSLVLPLCAHALEAGAVAPDFHAVTTEGKEISYFNDLKGKRPVYLIFWTTW